MKEPATRRQQVEAKERAILQAARAVFIEHGFEGARMADIARHAGVAEGTVYLYYTAKQALMEAVVAQFWAEITEDALSTVDADADTMTQIGAFARYHLLVIVEHIDFIDLTAVLRTSAAESIAARDLVRAYIQVFDDILRRGFDRGEICTDTPPWIIRDLFSGCIEHSARTMVLHDQTDPDSVVNNLVKVFQATYGPYISGENPTGAKPTNTPGLPNLIDRLEAAVNRLERR